MKNGNDKVAYTPIFWLASLGSGGMSVAFYMYLTFMTPHKGLPMATFDTLARHFNNIGIIGKVFMILAATGILYFAYRHLKLLFWNIKQWKEFKNSNSYEQIRGTLKEVSFMAMPLTYAMTINVMFIVGAVMVPGLWNIVEYLFPIAVGAFIIVGYYAFKIFGEYFINFVIKGNISWEENNNFVQLLSVFAFAMIGVGLAAPGAMSHIKIVNAIGMFGSFIFIAASILLMMLKFVLGFHAIAKNGIAKAATPSLWILIPILTLIGISLFRHSFGLSHNFSDGHADMKSYAFYFIGFIFAIQTVIGMFGYGVMKKIGYFDEYIDGETKDPASYALICPGVAYFVFGMFFVFWGLIFNHIIQMYSIAHFILIALLAIIQIKTVIVLLKLNKKFDL